MQSWGLDNWSIVVPVVIAVSVILVLGSLRLAVVLIRSAAPAPHAQYVRSAVRSSVRRGIPSAMVSAEDAPPDALFPILGRAGPVKGRRVRLWLYRDDHGSVPSGSLGIGPPTQRYLGLAGSPSSIVLQVPTCIRLKVVLAPALDLPAGASVHVSRLVAAQFEPRGRHRFALLTAADGVSFPVRLIRRQIDGGSVCVPMSLRTLGSITVNSTVQLSALPRTSGWEWGSRAYTRAFSRPSRRSVRLYAGIALGATFLCVRLLDYLIELALRLALRSQPMCFRVIQASPGDDDLRETAKLHPAAFTTLGVRPGGQVMVCWGDQSVAVRVLEDQTPIGPEPSAHVLQSVGLHLDGPALPASFPAHLVVRIPAPVRRTLTIPPDTIVEVRRRLRPAVVSQLNQLTISTAGLVLAAAAFPAVRGWPLFLGGLASVVLGLAPLRMPRPPRGHWP